MKSLAPRQVEILKYLKQIEDSSNPNDLLYRYPATPAQIAGGIGMNDLPPVKSRGMGSGRGRGNRVFNPAQRIISSLTGLSRRGLIAHASRPDGYSGAAYSITEEGRKAVDG